MRSRAVVRLTAAGVVACGGVVLGMGSAPAGASATHVGASGLTLDLGPSPTGIPANCPFGIGDFALAFTAGNAVQYGTATSGGSTVTGPAVLSLDGTPVYAGRATAWDGGSSNHLGGLAFADTLAFMGTGLADSSASLSIHVSEAMAVPPGATAPAASPLNINIVCS